MTVNPKSETRNPRANWRTCRKEAQKTQELWKYGLFLRFLRCFAASPDCCNYLSKQILNSEAKGIEQRQPVRVLDFFPFPPFEFVSGFGFRISDFTLRPSL